MSKKIKRLHTAINFFEKAAIVVAGISLVLLIMFSGETISPEYDKFQFILLFSILFILIISFGFLLFIEKKFKYSKFLFDIEYKDFERRAKKVTEAFQQKKEFQECLVSLGKVSPSSLKELKASKNEAIAELKREYISLS